MRKLHNIFISIVGLLLAGFAIVSAAPTETITQNLYPQTTDTYSVGTTTRQYLNGYFKNIYLDGNKISTSSTPTWGNITGILSNQTDLQNALNAKLSTTTASTTYVPYTGASANVLLGVNKLQTPVIFPASDSTTALQFNKADGTTNVLNIDTTNGRVGIGTTSPSANFEVSAASAPEIRISNNNTLYNNPSLSFYSVYPNGNERNWGIITSVTALGDFSLMESATNGSSPFAGNTRFYINNLGNVGIGTTNPGYSLDVAGSFRIAGVSDTYGIITRPANTNDGEFIFKTGGASDWLLGQRGLTNSDFHLYTYGTSADALTVLRASGNVGIGTTAPKAKLSVNGSLATKLREVSSATTTTITDSIIGVISTSSPITITLADATTLDSGQEITIKDEGGNASSSNITIATTASQKIDSASTFTIGTNYGSVTLYSNGSNYYVK